MTTSIKAKLNILYRQSDILYLANIFRVTIAELILNYKGIFHVLVIPIYHIGIHIEN